jgi:hypothetical protein
MLAILLLIPLVLFVSAFTFRGRGWWGGPGRFGGGGFRNGGFREDHHHDHHGHDHHGHDHHGHGRR